MSTSTGSLLPATWPRGYSTAAGSPCSVTRANKGSGRYGSSADRSANAVRTPGCRHSRRTPSSPAEVSSSTPSPCAATECTPGPSESSSGAPPSGSSRNTCWSAGSPSPASTSSRPSGHGPSTRRTWRRSSVSAFPSSASPRAAGVSAEVSTRPSGSRCGVPGSGSTQNSSTVQESSRVPPVAGSALSSSTHCCSRSATVSSTSPSDAHSAATRYGNPPSSQRSRVRSPFGRSTQSWTSAFGPPACG